MARWLAEAGGPGCRRARSLSGLRRRRQTPWHFLYFLPEPHQQGSLRPILALRCADIAATAPPPTAVDVTAAALPGGLIPPGSVPPTPSPVTSGRLSCMRRTGCAGGCTTL